MLVMDLNIAILFLSSNRAEENLRSVALTALDIKDHSVSSKATEYSAERLAICAGVRPNSYKSEGNSVKPYACGVSPLRVS